MGIRRTFVLPILALLAGTLCGTCVQAQGKAARAEVARVRIVHCSDVVCSTGSEGMTQGALALRAHFPQWAGSMLRVVVVNEGNKRVSLIDVRSDVNADGQFRVDLPVQRLGQGTYDIGVLVGSRFLADGRIQVAAAARRHALPRHLQARISSPNRMSAVTTGAMSRG